MRSHLSMYPFFSAWLAAFPHVSPAIESGSNQEHLRVAHISFSCSCSCFFQAIDGLLNLFLFSSPFFFQASNGLLSLFLSSSPSIFQANDGLLNLFSSRQMPSLSQVEPNCHMSLDDAWKGLLTVHRSGPCFLRLDTWEYEALKGYLTDCCFVLFLLPLLETSSPCSFLTLSLLVHGSSPFHSPVSLSCSSGLAGLK